MSRIECHHLDSYPRDELINHLIKLPQDTLITGFLVKEFPSNPEAEKYYKHENGDYRSIKNRMEFAMTVDCPEAFCSMKAGSPCMHLQTAIPIKYPHNSRFREAQRQANESQQSLF